jgi:hypothetical protein
MTWEHKGIYWELAGHNYSNSPWIYEAETGYVVEGTLTPTKGFKGVTKASLTRAKNYAERQLSKYKISNPSPPKNKWLPVSAVKFNQNGSVSMRGSKVSNPKRKKRNPTDFEQQHVKGKVWIIRRYDSWYPVEKTPQGNFAFLHGSGRGSVDGTKADALRFAKQSMKK